METQPKFRINDEVFIGTTKNFAYNLINEVGLELKNFNSKSFSDIKEDRLIKLLNNIIEINKMKVVGVLLYKFKDRDEDGNEYEIDKYKYILSKGNGCSYTFIEEDIIGIEECLLKFERECKTFVSDMSASIDFILRSPKKEINIS